MAGWRTAAIALTGYAVALAAMMPATLADTALLAMFDGRVRLAEARGTLWAGSGHLEMRDSSGGQGVTGAATWRLRPADLLRARLAYDVQPDTGQKAFRLAITWSRVEMEDAEFTLPAAALELASPRLVPLGLTGNLQIKVPQLWIERGAAHGGGTLRWRTAGSSLAPVSPMGDYELRFQAAGPAVRATLHTLQGPLQLEGEGAWSAGASPVFRAIARMPEKVRLRMAPFLRLIAAERTDGSFELQLK